MIRFKENNYNRIFVGVSNFIRTVCGGDRLKRITDIIEKLLRETHKDHKKKLKVLDFGCGSMEISKKLQYKKYIKQIVGSDIFKHKFVSKKMMYLDNEKLFKSNKRFDVIFVVDVLHHIGIENAHKIIRKLYKHSDKIIIKDHYEHGFFSRSLLRFVDFYANYGYGVNIPKKYFNKNSWRNTITKSKSKVLFHKENFQQHDGIFNIILNKKHHFVSIIETNE
tara:strand:- start:988 stop:1653 length:666 start_codon:yes stop_codon:yes gene_type:complete